MKKNIIIFLVMAILFAYDVYTKEYNYAIYEVTLNNEIISNNSVGNDWEIIYTCEDKVIENKTKWTIPIENTETKTIIIHIAEKDKIPDIGTGTITISLRDEVEETTLITVTEDGGAYEGSKAVWKIYCKVKLTEKK